MNQQIYNKKYEDVKGRFFNIITFIILYIFYITSIIGQHDQVGYLSIQNSDNMNIYIDTTLVADHSFNNLSLKSGTYIIRAEYPTIGFNWLNTYFKQTIKIAPDTCIKLYFSKENFINLKSYPYGGNLFLNEKFIGITPILLKKSDYLNKSVLIKKNGYKDQLITINANQTQYKVTLNPESQNTNKIDNI